MATLIPNNLQIFQTFKIHKIMATSKSFFGKRRGSTKNFTFAVFNGKQVTKEKAEQVKNPRTLAQMKNRMILTTSSAAYAAMKEIVDHSFQGYIYGLQNMSRFQSVNNKLLRANIGVVTPLFAYANYGEAKLLPGAYKVSEGTLTPVNGTTLLPTNVDGVTWILPKSDVGDSTSAAQLLAAMGISVGELATFVFIAPADDNSGYKFGFIRLTSIQSGDVALSVSNFQDYFTVESNLPVEINGGGGAAIYFHVKSGFDNAKGKYGAAVIHSAIENGSWKRSEEVLEWKDDFVFAPSAETAIATYPVGGSYILNDGEIPGGIDATPAENPEP